MAWRSDARLKVLILQCQDQIRKTGKIQDETAKEVSLLPTGALRLLQSEGLPTEDCKELTRFPSSVSLKE